ncbi:hypothetical protein [uncultured Gimesia sp.]|uniref:hypothetical protein n=1 Tax=uncultured Gimesia sp. TaxID=1678688 RepID=UPI0030D86DD5|tara:strand:+ start:89422 stop:90096 length:675 start_codon:yes stop_codon:yes gene_type:complete
MNRKAFRLVQFNIATSTLFVLTFATISTNSHSAIAEPEKKVSLKSSLVALQNTVDELVKKTKELERLSIEQKKKIDILIDSQPRSFFGKKKLNGISASSLKDMDKLEIECKKLPIAFFLMPADNQNESYDKFASIRNGYGGGAGAAFRVIRIHNNQKKVIASVSWHDGHSGGKLFPGARFLGIDESPPKQGKVVYTLEMMPVGGTVTLINAKFAAYELPMLGVR